jgi:hypothetical protein
MKLSEDQEKLKGLLQETITLLCKNGLNYKAEFSVEALIVVTLDQEQMFHANIRETICKEGVNLTLQLDNSPASPKSSSRKAKKRRTAREGSPDVPVKKTNVTTKDIVAEVEESNEEAEDDLIILKNEHKYPQPVPGELIVASSAAETSFDNPITTEGDYDADASVNSNDVETSQVSEVGVCYTLKRKGRL